LGVDEAAILKSTLVKTDGFNAFFGQGQPGESFQGVSFFSKAHV
jgi:hypothetical protein